MPSINIPAPSGADVVEFADWVEAAILAESKRRLSRAQLRSRTRDALFMEGSELEEFTDLLLQEFERRKRNCPDGYPFVKVRGGLQKNEEVNSLAYGFLLMVCISPFFRKTTSEEQTAARLFEHVLLDALKSYLGPRSAGRRFGWPPRGDRPPAFGEGLDWLGRAIGLKPGPGHRPPEQNDGGLDVIAWRPFSDRKPAHLTVLGQATISPKWVTKSADIVEDIWRGWLDFGKSPARCLGVPFQVPDTIKSWDRLFREVSVMLDRSRICQLISEGGLSHIEETSEWTKREIQRVAD
jgi:hypothetical protein